MYFLFRLPLLALALLATTASAEPVSTKYVTAELISENQSARPGTKAWIGLRLEMAPHWHTYWRFPGDSGLPTKVEWKLPEGWKVSQAHWPIPSRIPLPPLINFGYEGETLIGYELDLPAKTADGTYQIEGNASWLVCKEECIPEKAALKLNVKVGKAEPRSKPWRDLFVQLRKQQPQELPQGAFSSIRLDGKDVHLEFDNEPSWLEGKIDFFPLVAQVIKGAEEPKVKRSNGMVTLTMAKANPFTTSAKEFSGQLIVASNSGNRVYEISVPLGEEFTAPATAVAPSTEAAPVEVTDEAGIFLAAIFAFLGGVLLNLMPCVFPVLGIKIMSLVSQGGGDKWHVRKHGKVYALGVLVSFWALTAALLALRSAGQSVGWGFQLQQPAFVLVLIFLFSLLTASLAGFFEFGSRLMGVGSGLANKDGMTGSFFTGMLAVIVATPCTAPFMGTAIGVVLAQPSWAVFVVFTCLGLGLAAPFVALSYWPALLKALPRPGVWMQKLKELFAFPMAATVLWLLWVLGMQIGLDGLIITLIGLLVLFLSIWVGRRFKSPLGRGIGWVLLALACLIASSALRWQPGLSNASEQNSWKKFSEEAVSEALAADKEVFIDFTAAWCLSCQVNKTLVLDRAPMQKFFSEKGIVLFRADWTNHDVEITKALENHGRIGVPLYLAYAKGKKQAKVLPQILTEDLVRRAFP